MEPEMCFYVPGQDCFIDLVRKDGTTDYFRQTLEEVQEYFPGAILIPHEEAKPQMEAAKRKKYTTSPKEITSEHYLKMRKTVSEIKLETTEAGETFFSDKTTSTFYTTIFCRIGDRHFQFNDSRFLTANQIINIVKDSLVYNAIALV